MNINGYEQFGKQRGRTRLVEDLYLHDMHKDHEDKFKDPRINGVFVYPETSFTNVRWRSICLIVFLYSIHISCI